MFCWVSWGWAKRCLAFSKHQLGEGTITRPTRKGWQRGYKDWKRHLLTVQYINSHICLRWLQKINTLKKRTKQIFTNVTTNTKKGCKKYRKRCKKHVTRDLLKLMHSCTILSVGQLYFARAQIKQRKIKLELLKYSSGCVYMHAAWVKSSSVYKAGFTKHKSSVRRRGKKPEGLC